MLHENETHIRIRHYTKIIQKCVKSSKAAINCKINYKQTDQVVSPLHFSDG